MKRTVFLLMVLIMIFSIQIKSEAIEKNFVIFVMDGVSLSEIKSAQTPNLDSLIDAGAIALTNTRTAGSLEPKDAYLTIGAGDRARTGVSAYLNFNIDEDYKGTNVKELYSMRTGRLDFEAQMLNIELARLIATNEKSDYQAKVGQLADKLAEKSLTLAVLGNADIWQQPRRHIAMLGINKYGLISKGDIGQKMLLASDQYPSAYITNQDYLLDKFDKLVDQTDLLIIESGDTSRVEAVKSLLLEERFLAEKKRSIERVDKLLGRVSRRLDFNRDYLFVLIPTPSKRAVAEGEKLSLSLLVGPDSKGLLRSATTKRAGLISNLDIAPTIYSYLGGQEETFTGSAVEAVSSNKSIDYLIGLNQRIEKTFAWRPILIKGFILLQIITLFLVAFIILYKKSSERLKKVVKYLLLSLLWIPLLFLLSKYFLAWNLILVILFIISLSFLLTYCLLRLTRNELIHIWVISTLTWLLLAIDLWTGANLIKLSVLGYSPVIGARFYGIGNEFMGIIIGAGIISLTIFKEFRKGFSLKLLILSFFFLIVTVGHPNLGANFGGLITTIVVSSATYFYLKGYNLNLKVLFKITIILVAIVSLIVYLDTQGVGANQTHLANTIAEIRREGLGTLINIIYRKISMNLKLLRWTIWTRVLLSFVIILIILFKRPRGVIRDIIDNYGDLAAAFKALIIGSIVTMVVNDSGVVAAATLLLFPIFTLLYLVLNRINNR
ncbi:hypothetical protein BX659_13119 [Orenia metallireducens]|uniref:Uncharacterized protein n=1 Tax=Orenia metallireducens TaxID=1413210 RepID=A0A285I8M4_9FIRM|nr:hypothetical protein [Orenia metallireducens]PRX21677.1 hypothetical protein BX659_13119 [Orenia metallireducens]SNY44314.1 hypothetical protein SAMN06265827_13419 [Orenia metallireducens]